jgi:hypothetical protein
MERIARGMLVGKASCGGGYSVTGMFMDCFSQFAVLGTLDPMASSANAKGRLLRAD